MKSIVLLFLFASLVSSSFLQVNTETVGDNSSCTQDCCKTLSPSRPPMTYYYYQNTGRFKGGEGDYAINTMGYSGIGDGYLNPDYQCVSNIGPLPASTYKITYCKNIMH